MNATQRKILTALNETKTAMTSRELAQATGVTGPTAKGNADKLLKRGDIKAGPKRGNAFTYIGTGVEAPAETPKAPEPGRVECQICEGHFAEDKRGNLWNHGYQRPGYGWLVGGCWGVGHKPFPETGRLEEYLVLVTERQTSTKAVLAKRDEWPTLTYEERVRTGGYSYENVMKTITRPTAEDYAEKERAYASHSALGSQRYQATKGEAEPLTAEEEAQCDADYAIWSDLFPVLNLWKSQHDAKVRRLTHELRLLATEIERVTQRIAKGKALRAPKIVVHPR